MSRTRLIKRTAKISVKVLILIIIFFTVGKINMINPKKNATNAIVKSTAAKIVNAVILFNFLTVNNCLILSRLNKLLQCKLRYLGRHLHYFYL